MFFIFNCNQFVNVIIDVNFHYDNWFNVKNTQKCVVVKSREKYISNIWVTHFKKREEIRKEYWTLICIQLEPLGPYSSLQPPLSRQLALFPHRVDHFISVKIQPSISPWFYRSRRTHTSYPLTRETTVWTTAGREFSEEALTSLKLPRGVRTRT